MNAVFGWTLAVAVIALFCTLGFWQLGRGSQKQAMLDEVQQVVAQRKVLPLSVADDSSRRSGYDWTAGRGRFLQQPAILLDNQINHGRVGIRVYRLFQPDTVQPDSPQRPDEASAPLLVDLGWLPLPGDRRLPMIEPMSQITQVSGLLAPPPSAGIATPGVTPTPQGDLLSIGLDHAVLSQALSLPQLAPRILKLDPDLPFGYQRDLEILPNTLPPARHLGYAVQWFGLAAAVFVIAVVMTLRQRRRKPGAHEKMTA